MRQTHWIIWIVLAALLMPFTGVMQETPGLPLVDAALQLTGQSCQGLNRNQACYGHALLSANPRAGSDLFSFSESGDVEDLAKIQTLRLSGMDLTAGTWGVALMELRANLPSARPENITVVAFGDVALDNAVLPQTRAEVQVRANTAINVRMAPTTQAGPVGALRPGQTVTAVERTADSAWLRVLLPDSEQTGWVFADLVGGAADAVQGLNVAASTTTYFTEPMQAFYFQSGAPNPDFAELPPNGLLIQTPEGVGEVQLLINEINIQLGSTVFFEATPGGQMIVSTLEGHADVRAFGLESRAYAGTQVTVPLTADLKPAGPPSQPQPYNLARLQNLPLGLLKKTVIPAEPLPWVDLQRQQAQDAAELNGETSTSTVSGSGSSSSGGACCATATSPDDCPGQSCNAPGQGGTCPGGSCDNPGRGTGTNETGKDKDKKK
jgi:hypothetical protein